MRYGGVRFWVQDLNYIQKAVLNVDAENNCCQSSLTSPRLLCIARSVKASVNFPQDARHETTRPRWYLRRRNERLVSSSGYKGISIAIWDTKEELECPPPPTECAFPTGRSVLDYLEFEGGNSQLWLNFIYLVRRRGGEGVGEVEGEGGFASERARWLPGCRWSRAEITRRLRTAVRIWCVALVLFFFFLLLETRRYG